jgi:hypothetical protein
MTRFRLIWIITGRPKKTLIGLNGTQPKPCYEPARDGGLRLLPFSGWRRLCLFSDVLRDPALPGAAAANSLFF